MVKIGDCPHCHSRVAVKRDGVCPNCQQNTNDLTGVDAGKATLHIEVASALPDLCCLCGVSTRRRVRVEDGANEKLQRDPAGSQVDGDSLAIGLLGGVVGLLIAAGIGAFSGASGDAGGFRYRRVVASVPQCENCSRDEIVPIESDFDLQTIKILVCHQFKSAYREANRQA